MQKQKLPFQQELKIPIYYDDQQIGSRRADFLIDEKVLVELKALVKLEDVPLSTDYQLSRSLQLGDRITY